MWTLLNLGDLLAHGRGLGPVHGGEDQALVHVVLVLDHGGEERLEDALFELPTYNLLFRMGSGKYILRTYKTYHLVTTFSNICIRESMLAVRT